MKLTKTLLTLATCALTLGFAACDDDSDNEEKPVCDAGKFQCDGTTVKVCANGSDGKLGWQESKKCNANQTCNATAGTCDSGTPQITQVCEVGKFKCNKNTTVQKCIATDDGANKWTIAEKCATGVCNDKSLTSGKCEIECDDSYKSTCEGTKVTSCKNGRIKVDACDLGEICTNGGCAIDTNVSTVAQTAVGNPCECRGTGDECNIIITGKEIKSALGSSTQSLAGLAGLDLNKLGDDERIVAPNYFSSKVTGCEDLTAPSGMAVGCFYTRSIELPDGLISLINDVPGLLDKVGSLLPALAGMGVSLGDVDIDEIKSIVNKLVARFNKEKGIPFVSNGGYCVAANIGIDINVTDETIKKFIIMDNVNKMVDKIEVGNSSQVNVNSCPEGAEMIAFNAGDSSDKGSAQVAFNVCLKTCKSSADCKAGDSDNRGLECVTIEDDYKKHQVCFEQDNIDYFTAMTKDLGLETAE